MNVLGGSKVRITERIKLLEAKVASLEEAEAELGVLEQALATRFSIAAGDLRDWLVHEIAAGRVVEDEQLLDWHAALHVVADYEEVPWQDPDPATRILLMQALVLHAVRRCGPLHPTTLTTKVARACEVLTERWERWEFSFAAWAGTTLDALVTGLVNDASIRRMGDASLRVTPRGIRYLDELAEVAAPWERRF